MPPCVLPSTKLPSLRCTPQSESETVCSKAVCSVPSTAAHSLMNQQSAPCSLSRAGRRKGERKNQVQIQNLNKNQRVQKQVSLQDRPVQLQEPPPLTQDALFLRNKERQGLLNQLAPKFFALSRCQTTKERRSKKHTEWQLGRSSSVSVAVVRGGTTNAVRQQFNSTPVSMSSRGQNVSVLHLRGPPEPWEAAVAGSLRSARSSPPGQRELSPVRWCGSEDAGVYLGRSGWVQVQQHSLDEQRRACRAANPTTVPVRESRTIQNIRVRLADCHSTSEPGRRRPDTLALPRGQKAEMLTTPSPLLPAYDPSSPPPITPIISPPPAFQDMEPARHKPPHLSRSVAAVDADSPPLSPITRFRHRTPSPKSSNIVRRPRNVSASSSEEEGCWKATLPLRRASPRARSSDSSSSGGDADTWGGRVRRSRSLQLPEERPPPAHRPRRQLPKKTLSEDTRNRIGLRPDAAAEARAVAEFVSRVRSRTAARDLLLSRYLQKPEAKPDRATKGQAYNVCVVGDKQKPQAYNVCLVNGRSVRDHTGGCGSPCNPSTCDFWPHCSHRQSPESKAKSKFENVDIDGYVSVRRSNNRGESPRSRSPHTGTSPQNRSPHANASPQDPPIRSARSPDRETSSLNDPWKLNTGEARMRSGASTPVSSGRSPPTVDRLKRGGNMDGSRVANASTSGWDHLRSMSLPKSFLSHRAGVRPIGSSHRFPEESLIQPEPYSRTAPVTPVRELSVVEATDALAHQSYSHSTSAPVLDLPLEKEIERNDVFIPSGRVSAPPDTTPVKSSQDSVVEKLRKSISLRFNKSRGKNGKAHRDDLLNSDNKSLDGVNDSEKEDINRRDIASERSSPSEAPSDIISDYRFRFGPLVWRSSKERKRGQQLGRGGIFRSADSGIHVERSMAAESSDSRDTDPNEEPDSPLRKNERHVQRANSEMGGLGGRRLLDWESRRKPRFRRKQGPVSCHNGTIGEDGPPGPLRRSTSQPLGLDEVSPLRKARASSEDDHGTSEDEALFGSESSLLSLNSGKAPEMVEDAAIAEALWDHVAMDGRELAFRAGDLIQVHNTTDRDWWWGAAESRTGWFPSSFVRLRVSQEDTVEDCLAAMAAGSRAAAHLRRTSVSLLSNDQVRSCVVRELLTTERDFVRGLRDVAEGYIIECRLRSDMFTPQQIHAIFGNLEELLEFQSCFLEELESRVDTEAPHRSCMGDVFLRHQSGFRKYSEYCNSHPTAIATLQQLYQQPTYSAFFEGCRIMRGLIEIPLDGYLLTPVQRICKYPLQLAELLKYTRPEHEDHVPVKEALSVMKGVAVLVNERKRRMESLEKIASWQARVEGWEGEDLLEKSSQLLHQDDVIRVTSGMWTTHISIFLFDHQLVYCKKDLLKRHHLGYKGRMCLDTSEVVDVPDGKEPVLGATVRNAVKIHSLLSDKWLLFCCRSSQSKARWLAALAAERRLVLSDRQEGLELTPAARHLARAQAMIRADKTKLKREGSYGELATARRMGNWFTWGGRKQQPVT